LDLGCQFSNQSKRCLKKLDDPIPEVNPSLQ
jgi:hypothetical protein